MVTLALGYNKFLKKIDGAEYLISPFTTKTVSDLAAHTWIDKPEDEGLYAKGNTYTTDTDCTKQETFNGARIHSSTSTRIHENNDDFYSPSKE